MTDGKFIGAALIAGVHGLADSENGGNLRLSQIRIDPQIFHDFQIVEFISAFLFIHQAPLPSEASIKCLVVQIYYRKERNKEPKKVNICIFMNR